MSEIASFERLPPQLAQAMLDKGYQTLTKIQAAVLAPELAGNDLRLSSQTGSGKTVAIGLIVAEELSQPVPPAKKRVACPSVLIIAPTRELATQLGDELGWLFRSSQVRTAVVTGGTAVGGDFSQFNRAPTLLIGTPGRLADHLRRGSISLDYISSVVLDEADEMLDMGFREELEKLLDATPSERRTHLVSATLPRSVVRLADRYQRDPTHVQGTRLGDANIDIEHQCMLMNHRDKETALINVLLTAPQERTLVFARTRIATAELALKLSAKGFAAAALHGDMSQRERTATLESFREQATAIVVATDVAARGLDIKDVTRVIHFDLPENAAVLTHRSGRTGRAGNKGKSIAFVGVREQRRADQLFHQARMETQWISPPSPRDIHAIARSRFVEELSVAEPPSQDHDELAHTLLANDDAHNVVAKLLARTDYAGPCKARPIATVERDNAKKKPKKSARPKHEDNFRPFYINWGAKHGANPGQLLATVCRRGGITRAEVGRIHIDQYNSVVEVVEHAADGFLQKAKAIDPRAPKLKIRQWEEKSGHPAANQKPGRPLARKQKPGHPAARKHKFRAGPKAKRPHKAKAHGGRRHSG